MSIIQTRVVTVLLALSVIGFACPAYSQSDDSKTGAGPRGTPAAPSTNPAQPSSALKPPSGMDKSGTPVAPAMDTTTAKQDQPKGKGQ